MIDTAVMKPKNILDINSNPLSDDCGARQMPANQVGFRSSRAMIVLVCKHLKIFLCFAHEEDHCNSPGSTVIANTACKTTR